MGALSLGTSMLPRICEFHVQEISLVKLVLHGPFCDRSDLDIVT